MADTPTPPGDGASGGIRAAARTKLGPVPVWMIGAGIGLGYVVWRRLRPAPVDPTGTDAIQPDSSDSAVGPFGSSPLLRTIGGSGVVAGAGSGTPAGTNEPTVDSSVIGNDEWRIKATTALRLAGYDPLAAEAAVAKFLNGEDLTGDEWSTVNMAIGRIGVPPIPVPTPRRVAEPAPLVPAPTPPAPVAQPAPAPAPAAPSGPQGFTGPTGSLHVVIGERSDNVRRVQAWFMAALPDIASRYGVRPTGVYDEPTAEAVREWARRTGTPLARNEFGISAEQLAKFGV